MSKTQSKARNRFEFVNDYKDKDVTFGIKYAGVAVNYLFFNRNVINNDGTININSIPIYELTGDIDYTLKALNNQVAVNVKRDRYLQSGLFRNDGVDDLVLVFDESALDISNDSWVTPYVGMLNVPCIDVTPGGDLLLNVNKFNRDSAILKTDYSELTDEYDEVISDARKKVINDFTATLRLFALSIRIQHLTVDNLSSINSASGDDLLRLITNCATAFYSKAIKRGRMNRFPRPVSDNDEFQIPVKHFNNELMDYVYNDKTLQSSYSISIKDWLTYITPFLKHVAGAYKGSSAIFQIAGSSPVNSAYESTSGNGMNFTNVTRSASRNEFHDDNHSTSVIQVKAGDIIVLTTVDRNKFRCMPGVKCFLRENHFELRCYRESLVEISDDVPWGLFNDVYDSCVLIATKHDVTNQEYTFTGDNFVRLVNGETVDLGSYQFKMNGLVKIALDKISNSYYCSNEVIQIKFNGNLLDIVDIDFYPIAAGDFASIACNLQVLRNEGGEVTGIKVSFDNEAYINTLQAPFNANYTYNANNHGITINQINCATFDELISGDIPLHNYDVKLIKYASLFANPQYVSKTINRTKIVDYTFNWDIGNITGYVDSVIGDNVYREAAAAANFADNCGSLQADNINTLCVVTDREDGNGNYYALMYHCSYDSYIDSTPKKFLRMSIDSSDWEEISSHDFNQAVSNVSFLKSVGKYALIKSGAYESNGSSIVTKLSQARTGRDIDRSMIGDSVVYLTNQSNFYSYLNPKIDRQANVHYNVNSNYVNANLLSFSDLMDRSILTVNLTEFAETVESISLLPLDNDLSIIGVIDQDQNYSLDHVVSNADHEMYFDWDLEIFNSLTIISDVGTLFDEGDQQFISSHVLNVFINRTGIAESITSYVAPEIEDISPTLLADAQTFMQSGMRDAIESTLVSIESVLLDNSGVIKSEDIDDTDSQSLVYYINKDGRVDKGIFNQIKNLVHNDSDVVTADVIDNNSSNLISIPRFNSENQLIFDAPCKLDNIPTTLSINGVEVPLYEAVLYNKLYNPHAKDILEEDVNQQNLADYVTRMVDVYGDYTETMIENDMTSVIDEIAESSPDISLSDATALIQAKVDQIQSDVSSDSMVIDAINSMRTISSRLQEKILGAAKKAKTTTTAVVADAYSKFGSISNGISAKVSAFASKIMSCANDVAGAIVKLFGTSVSTATDNWSNSNEFSNRSNLALAFDVNLPTDNIIGLAKSTCKIIGHVTGKLYDKCANYVRKTFKDGVSFKVNQSGYETLDCPAYQETLTYAEFINKFGGLATYLLSYRESMNVDNITFVTQLNTSIIFIQVYAANYVKLVINPLIDIEDNSNTTLNDDLDFLDSMLNAIERSIQDYVLVCQSMNELLSILNQHYRDITSDSQLLDTNFTFNRNDLYKSIFKGAKVSTKERKAKGWKIAGWVTAAAGAVLCCTGIGAAVGGTMMVAGARIAATGYVIEATGMTKDLSAVLKKARNSSNFANSEITSAELLNIWDHCPAKIGGLYSYLLPICFEGGYVHPGSGRLLEDDRYVPCAIFAGFPKLKYSLITDKERAKRTRTGLAVIGGVIIGTVVAARLATSKVRARRKYKTAVKNQYYPSAPSRDAVYDDNGQLNPWYSIDKDGNEIFNQAKFTKAVNKYQSNQEKYAWQSLKYGNIVSGSASIPLPNYDGAPDFIQLSSVIGYKRKV